MDIFATAITAGEVVLQFVRACATYSDDAESLGARFQWDLRALRSIRDYFEQREAQNANQQLSEQDAALLEQTAKCLDILVSKVQKSLHKINRKGFLRGIFNRGMWIARQADLKEMEKEVYEWTKRFDVRVLGLPIELRAVIPASPEARPPTVIKSNTRLREFLELATSSQEMRAREMISENSLELAEAITRLGDFCFRPVQREGKQLIFASRQVSHTVSPQTPSFDKLQSEMGMLAAALNCLDSAADIRLLKVESFFYHANTRRFLFAQASPYPIVSMMTLEDVIHEDHFPKAQATLDRRIKLAMKLAEAVFFLHAAGFVHKNITSSSIVALRRLNMDLAASLDDSYLMGFDLIRGIDSVTSKEGAVRQHEDLARSIWEFDLFQHPHRLCGHNSQRFTKSYDVYSLGVVLLEIGLWETLPEAVDGLNENDPSGWTEKLLDTASVLGPRTGTRYQRIVAWCLGINGNAVLKEEDFVEHVLDPLDEIASLLS